MEYEQANTEAYSNTQHDVRMLTIEPELTFEEFEIVIDHDPVEAAPDRVYYLCFTSV